MLLRDRVLSSIEDLTHTLSILSTKKPISAIYLSLQKRHFCPQELTSYSASDVNFTILPDIAAAAKGRTRYDFCLISGHIEGEDALLYELRKINIATIYCLWLWDNHHHHEKNFRSAMLADVVFASHLHDASYLNHPNVIFGGHMPACSRQWSAQMIAQRYPGGLPVARSDALYGGFGYYPWLPERNGFIERLSGILPKHSLSLGDVDGYYRRPVELRLKEWVDHKVHLVVPVARDLSTRVFEALMTGQIPMVPRDVSDLDRVVPADQQAALPILRYDPGSIESAQACLRDALARFDAEGAAGVARRHAFARDHHSLAARLHAFARFIRRTSPLSLRTDGRQFWWA